MLCGFWAIVHLPLAQAVALSYSTPIFVTIARGARCWAKLVRARRWAAVVRRLHRRAGDRAPGHGEFSLGSLVALLAAVLSAHRRDQIKQLSRTEPADAIVLYTTMLWVPLSLVPALFVWQWPHGITWLWVAAGRLSSAPAAHMLWTRALKLGDVSALTPISFMQLPVVGAVRLAAVR